MADTFPFLRPNPREISLTGCGKRIVQLRIPSGFAILCVPANFRKSRVEPAHEVESRVTEQLQAFLQSDDKVFDGLSAAAESPAIVQPLVAAA